MAALEVPVPPRSIGLRAAAPPEDRPPVNGAPQRDGGPVVCAVDLSGRSRHAMREADALARTLGSRLLVQVVRPKGLAAVAAAEGAELVVVGVPSRALIGSALLARRYRALLRDSPCPVVAVPPGARPDPAGRFSRFRARDSILCGIDAGDVALLTARVAADLGAQLRLRPIVLHAHEPGGKVSLEPTFGTAGPDPREEDARRAWALLGRTVEQLGAAAEGRLVVGWPAATLRRVAGRERSSLIVVGTSRPGLIRSVLCAAVPAQLVASATVPVVIVPRGARRWPGGKRHAKRIVSVSPSSV